MAADGQLPEIPADIGPSRCRYLLERVNEVREHQDQNDHGNLNQLGAALLELSQHYTDADGEIYLNESIEVLTRAEGLDRAHHTLWLLGSAYLYRATLSTRTRELQNNDRTMAHDYFAQAREQDPDNPLYAHYARTDRIAAIRDFLTHNWKWGAIGAVALAGLCSTIRLCSTKHRSRRSDQR